MRLWSLSPHYLDTKGLVALWREALLAKAVLEGKTKGYTNHPQLDRFKQSKNPIKYINLYLYMVWKEAFSRDLNFDINKFSGDVFNAKFEYLTITDGQLNYELNHLKEKLKKRDIYQYKEISYIQQINPIGIFQIVEGPIASWEKLK